MSDALTEMYVIAFAFSDDKRPLSFEQTKLDAEKTLSEDAEDAGMERNRFAKVVSVGSVAC